MVQETNHPRGNRLTFSMTYGVNAGGKEVLQGAIALGWRDNTYFEDENFKCRSTTPSEHPLHKERSKVVMRDSKRVTVDASYDVHHPAEVQ